MAFTMFALTACNVTPEDPGDNGDNPPAGQATKLDAPQITLNDNVISWSAVSNADAYDVYEGTTVVSSQATLSYIIDKHDGEAYTYTVKATSTNSNYTTSDASNAVTYQSIATYTVTFMMDETVFDKQTVVKGEKASAIATDPAKPGYIFDKWVTEKNGNTAYNFDTAINENTTVYAGWTAKVYDSYKVTFETNGGSAVEEQDVTAGGKAEEPTAPTKEDFDFAGWYVDEELTEEFDFNTAIDKATNLYAKWTLQTGVTAVTENSIYYFGSNATADTSNNVYALGAEFNHENESESITFDKLTLDVSTGKLSNSGRSDKYCAFTSGAKISFYVDKACTVKVSAYHKDYTVNGVAAQEQAQNDAVQSFEIAQPDKVEIVSTDNGNYIISIEVVYPEPLEPISVNTTWSFNSSDANASDNYYVFSGNISSGTVNKIAFDGNLRDNGGTWYETTQGTSISFAVSKACTVVVTTYQSHTDYTINGQAAESTHTYKFTKAQTIKYVATAKNYIGKIEVQFEEGSGDTPTIPANCEKVETTCDLNALAALYGVDKTSADITYGRFEFEKGLKFETSKNAINTQGKTIYVTVTGINDMNTLSFNVANGASDKFTGVTVTNAAGTVLASCGNESKEFVLEGLPAGKYTITSGGGSCRISNLKITEVLEQGSPVSMSVKPATVDFLKGGTFNSTGLTASVVYGNGATKSQTNLTVDSSSVDMTKEGEYIVRVFYTELGETVTATYAVKVYSVMSLTYSTYTTSGKTQVTLPTVYTVGGSFSVSGLTVNTVAKCGANTKSFIMKGSDYVISTPDLSTVGEKTVTITAKANSAVTATFTVNVVEKAEVVENTVTISVDRSKPVSSTNFHTIMGAMSYLGNFDAGVKKVVNIADGEYIEKVWINLPNVQLIGSATKTPDGTTDNGVVICFDAIAGKTDAMGNKYGTDGSGTVSVTNKADNFVAKNITFKNYYNTNALYNESKKIDNDTQAVALYVGSSSASFYNCKMTGYHDTLYTNIGNHYYKNCWIEGRTDFIFGQDANAYFDHCTIYTLDAGSDDGNGGYVCALKPSSNAYSFVFNGCTFDGPETGATDIALGRAWGANMKMVVINCEISGNYSTAAHTAGTTKKQRYCTMSGNEPKPENMLEYNNTGDGAVSESIANTCTVDASAATTYGIENLATILGFTPGQN